VDVSNLIQSGDVDAYLDGKEANNSFLEALKTVNNDQPEVGITWRWIVGVAADGLSLELCLQALPCNESTIKVRFFIPFGTRIHSLAQHEYKIIKPGPFYHKLYIKFVP